MSTAIRDNWVRAVWRMSVTLALLLGFLVPAWSAPTVLARGTLPETASAAPAGTAAITRAARRVRAQRTAATIVPPVARPSSTRTQVAPSTRSGV